MQSTVLPLSSRYREAIVFTLIQQVPCALLSLLMLDGGVMARICAITMLGFWAAVVLMMVRRPLSPSSFDIMFLRWGFFPLYSLVLGLGVALQNSV
jgi:hypothetical protein